MCERTWHNVLQGALLTDKQSHSHCRLRTLGPALLESTLRVSPSILRVLLSRTEAATALPEGVDDGGVQSLGLLRPSGNIVPLAVRPGLS